MATSRENGCVSPSSSDGRSRGFGPRGRRGGLPSPTYLAPRGARHGRLQRRLEPRRGVVPGVTRRRREGRVGEALPVLFAASQQTGGGLGETLRVAPLDQ